MIKVLVNGALGRMGSEVVKKVTAENDLTIAAVVDIKPGTITVDENVYQVTTDLVAAIKETKPDVVVDFTRPDVVMDNLRKVLALGVRAVVGTTAKYFPHVEIIEKHHDKKLDAPSGTAIITAQKISEVRAAIQQGNPDEKETMPGARGADYEGMKIHSVRLPGYVASQEVIFGGQGEVLRISTEPINRECYMPGVALGCRKIMDKQGLVYGLDKLL